MSLKKFLSSLFFSKEVPKDPPMKQPDASAQKFRYSICEPFRKNVIEKGSIAGDRILKTFQVYPWSRQIQEMMSRSNEEPFFSPSLEFENADTKHGITVSVVADSPEIYGFYVFYRRPANTDKSQSMLMTAIFDQSEEQVQVFLQALVYNDTDFLARNISNPL